MTNTKTAPAPKKEADKNEKTTTAINTKGELVDSNTGAKTTLSFEEKVQVEERMDKVRRVNNLSEKREELLEELDTLTGLRDSDPSSRITLELKGKNGFITNNTSLIRQAVDLMVIRYEVQIGALNKEILAEKI